MKDVQIVAIEQFRALFDSIKTERNCWQKRKIIQR